MNNLKAGVKPVWDGSPRATAMSCIDSCARHSLCELLPGIVELIDSKSYGCGLVSLIRDLADARLKDF